MQTRFQVDAIANDLSHTMQAVVIHFNLTLNAHPTTII